MQLSVLVDTGSMKSILSAEACQTIFDFCTCQDKNSPTFRPNSNQCVSVTRQPLLSSGSMIAQFAFPGSQYLYEGEFLICDNVLQPLQCILGWDFIVSYRLQLSILRGTYVLVGPHGSTALTPLRPSTPSSAPSNLSAGKSANPSEGGNQHLFLQSPTWGPVKVTLKNNCTLPAPTECILSCHVPCSCINQLVMVSQHGESSQYDSVSQADNRHISVRVMNPSNLPLNLRLISTLPNFCQLAS